MGLFDIFKSKAKSSAADDVSGIMITLEVDGSQILFILLAQDGTINRLGTGTEDNADNDMFIGVSDGAAFAQVRALAGPIIDKWIGGYGAPNPEGKPCKLLVGFRTNDGRELMSHWEYGSESQGPHPDVAAIVVKAVEATEDWWLAQKAVATDKESSTSKDAAAGEESPGASLRRMMLTTPASELGFTCDAEFPTVCGLLTEWDMGGIIASVMSMRDGTASLYTTSDFGVIGGQGHDSVRRAVEPYVKTAEQFAESAAPVTEFPYPGSDQVFYYLLTYDGVRQVIGNMAAIQQGSDPTGPLFAAAQDVLTELRLITEKTEPGDPADPNARS